MGTRVSKATSKSGKTTAAKKTIAKKTTIKKAASKEVVEKKAVAKKAEPKKATAKDKKIKLVVVESPAKIKTITKFLGKDFKILSTFGHIKDLPPKKIGIERDEKTGKINLEYVVIEDKEGRIAEICKQASRSGEVYLASDPDREGEIISWHIGQEIAKVFKDKSKIYRITFNEITKPAVTQAIEDKTTVDMKKVRAQQARRILDRWVGYQVSPILWKKISKGLSAGRVQSVAMMLICQRDKEIREFVPEESWSVHAIFVCSDKSTVVAELFKIKSKTFKLKNEADAKKAVEAITKESFKVSKITEKERAKNPLPPFMTSTLQQDAYNKLGFSVDKTMSVAQKLYEGLPLADKNSPEALITYMRTDSLRLSDTSLKDIRKFISGQYGGDYLPKQSRVYGKKGAQDAHEAIRPIDIYKTPEAVGKYLSKDQAKLYELIWKRSVACQMEAARYFQRQVLIDGGDFTFKATGSSLMFDGFLKVYLVDEEDGDKNVAIPKDIKVDDLLKTQKIDKKQHFTQPPPRYTEATLVKEMEKRGIGRPSTYAAILTTIQKRKYCVKDNKRFMPTQLGEAVNEMLLKHLADIVNVDFTAKMEEDLDKIAQGEIERDKVLNEFYKKFEKDLKSFGVEAEEKKTIETNLDCPKCKNKLLIRLGRAGEFLGCSKYPDCTFTANVARDEKGNVKIDEQDSTSQAVDIKCEKCKRDLVRKVGRFGPFLACSGYPDCKYIHQESLKMKCPQCKSKIVKRKWRGGTMWGCSGYPDCKFAIFGDVVENKCPECKAPYLLVSKVKDGIKHRCADKECKYEKIVEQAS
ncbi:MAG: type I DNA topoisomerase [Epsilonproteobacteria bacterium]|nr:type I DNA topoisomerase [Campylobacterota bacterium]